MRVLQIILTIFAIIIILVGMVTAITPIPIGLPLVVIGFLMLATISPATLRFIRRHWRWLDQRLKWFQKKLPRWMTRSLRRSDPYPEGDAEDTNKDDEAEEDDAKKNAAIAELLRRRA